MVIEVGIAAGYVVAWAMRKARRVGGQLDAEADAVSDASLERLHEVVESKLGGHPVLAELVEEAAADGEVTDLTRQQLELAIAAAARKDDAFGQAVTELLTRLREAERACGHGVIAGAGSAVFSGDVHVRAEGGGIAFGQVAGDVSVGTGGAGEPLAQRDPERTRDDISGSTHVHAQDGGNAFGHVGQVIIQGSARRPARSAYLQQVRRIAPPELKGREVELAELAAFCREPGRGAYLWWQAGAWAGKSALLSTFVSKSASEMAPRVRVVSFFITARIAAQSTRADFALVLLEQLAELTAAELPDVLPEATREAFLLDLLAQAAVACQDAGGRLVLVVDGLDEDRSVTTGPDAQSIAGLLPAEPPAGMRVIVAGRPNPPVPDDVPDWHPLREPGIVRTLDESEFARDARRLARQELRGLLKGTELEQDLLGLVAAAGGGLSGADLAELTEAPLWQVEEITHGAAGRTFSRLASRWSPDTRPEVYLLSHEELQAAAIQYLSPRLDGYRDCLHAWADRYRGRGWPRDSPEYLIGGYYSLLADQGDLSRIVSCACDEARHDWMLNVTGGDAAALEEIWAALERVAAMNDPDLPSALALACHRDLVAERNYLIPVRLPAVWAALGQAARAEALAGAIDEPEKRAEALALVAEVSAEKEQRQAEETVPDPEQSAEDLARAEEAAYALTDLDRQARDLTQVAEALVGAGQYQRAAAVATHAEKAARSFRIPFGQAPYLAGVAGALARAGSYRIAVTVARSITWPDSQGAALAEVAAALAEAGHHDQAEATARSIASLKYRSEALSQVAIALGEAGQRQQAAAIAQHAGETARSITYATSRSEALARAAEALAGAGQRDQAEATAREVIDSPTHSDPWALSPVARGLAKAGQYHEAEAVARSIASPYPRALALAQVAEVLAASGQHRQAAAIASQAEKAARMVVTNAFSVAPIAEVLARAGLLRHSELVVRLIPDPGEREVAMARVVQALTGTGQHEQAMAVAYLITDPARQSLALARVALALASVQQSELAADTATQAMYAAYATAEVDVLRICEPLMRAAQALARTGQFQQAETIASDIFIPYWQEKALSRIAEALAATGQDQRAEAIARSIPDQERRGKALARVTEVLFLAGHIQAARRVAVTTCTAAKWTIAARPVLMLDPSAFATLASRFRMSWLSAASSEDSAFEL